MLSNRRAARRDSFSSTLLAQLFFPQYHQVFDKTSDFSKNALEPFMPHANICIALKNTTKKKIFKMNLFK